MAALNVVFPPGEPQVGVEVSLSKVKLRHSLVCREIWEDRNGTIYIPKMEAPQRRKTPGLS